MEKRSVLTIKDAVTFGRSVGGRARRGSEQADLPTKRHINI